MTKGEEMHKKVFAGLEKSVTFANEGGGRHTTCPLINLHEILKIEGMMGKGVALLLS